MKVALVGQPNSGKSTLFNAVAGYRSLTSNFAGTTVEYTHGQARVGGEVLELIDLPGLYSLTPTSPVEAVSRDYLLGGDWDVIVNVLDASQLARSLELTLELLDLESPMVVCLNMMDEAARKGMTIDTHALGIALGVPVVEAIGARGRGIIETFRTAQDVAEAGTRPHAFVYAPDAESVVEELAQKIATTTQGQPTFIPREPGVRSPEAEVRSRKSGQSPAHDCAEATLDCGGLTRPWNKTQKEGGAKPPQSKALRVSSCSGGHCHSACGGHHSASTPSPADSRGEAPVVSIAMAEPADLPPAALPSTTFPCHAVSITHRQSPLANSGLSSRAFPGPSTRAV